MDLKKADPLRRAARGPFPARLVPLGLAERLIEPTPLVAYYHMVSEESLPHVRHLHPYKSPELFLRDIELLARRYKPLSLAELLGLVLSGERPEARSFLLTFDDGYREMYTNVAPVLYRKGIPAVFFVCSDFIDNKAMSHRNKASLLIDEVLKDGSKWAAVREIFPLYRAAGPAEAPALIKAVSYADRTVLDRMAEVIGLDFAAFLRTRRPYLESGDIRAMIEQGFSFGGHGRDHPLYAGLSLDEQVGQTLDSVGRVRKDFGLPYAVFAFPHNDLRVPDAFYERIAGRVELTFATAAERRDSRGRRIQRLSFERSGESAGAVLRRYYLGKRARRLLRGLGLMKDVRAEGPDNMERKVS